MTQQTPGTQEDLQTLVRRRIAQGESRPRIRQEALRLGWSAEDYDRAIEVVDGPAARRKRAIKEVGVGALILAGAVSWVLVGGRGMLPLMGGVIGLFLLLRGVFRFLMLLGPRTTRADVRARRGSRS